MKAAQEKHTELYRLTRALMDNAISWLEPTSLCNLYCAECYQINKKNSRQSLEDVSKEGMCDSCPILRFMKGN